LDRGPDPELRFGEELLHGLRHHVRGRVPQDVAAVWGVDRDRLHLDTLVELVGEVFQVAVHASGDHRAVVGEELPGPAAGRHGPLGALTCADGAHGDGAALGHVGLLPRWTRWARWSPVVRRTCRSYPGRNLPLARVSPGRAG